MNEEKEFIRRIVAQVLKAKATADEHYKKTSREEHLKIMWVWWELLNPLTDICKRYRGSVFDYTSEQPKNINDVVVLSKEKLPPTTESKQEQNALEKIANHLQNIDENLYKILLMEGHPDFGWYSDIPNTPYTEEELITYRKKLREIRDGLVSDCTDCASDNGIITNG